MAFPFSNSGTLISCGGPGDSWFVGGSTVHRGDIEIIGEGGRSELYRSERYGMSGYSIPLASGTYDVALHFCETWFTTPGRRPMDITVAGIKIPTFDVFTDAGGARRPLAKIVRGVVVTGNSLEITWANPATAMINAIEITRPQVLLPEPVVAAPVEEPAPPPPPTVPAEPAGKHQCPEHAKRLGLTKLAFLEDFDDPSRINMGNRLNPGQTMCQVGDGNPVFGGRPNPPSAFAWKDSILTLKPEFSNYFAQLTTLSGTKDGWKGFALVGSGWCAEIRWRHPPSGERPAFWSMDERHWFKNQNSGMARYLEPDFIEWINGRYIGALHNHVEPSTTQTKSSHVIDSGKRQPPVDPRQFYVASAMAHPGGTEYSRWINGKRYTYGYNATDDRKLSYHDSDLPTPDWIKMLNDYRGPVMVGTGPAAPLEIDWIRVWTAP